MHSVNEITLTLEGLTTALKHLRTSSPAFLTLYGTDQKIAITSERESWMFPHSEATSNLLKLIEKKYTEMIKDRSPANKVVPLNKVFTLNHAVAYVDLVCKILDQNYRNISYLHNLCRWIMQVIRAIFRTPMEQEKKLQELKTMQAKTLLQECGHGILQSNTGDTLTCKYFFTSEVEENSITFKSCRIYAKESDKNNSIYIIWSKSKCTISISDQWQKKDSFDVCSNEKLIFKILSENNTADDVRICCKKLSIDSVMRAMQEHSISSWQYTKSPC